MWTRMRQQCYYGYGESADLTELYTGKTSYLKLVAYKVLHVATTKLDTNKLNKWIWRKRGEGRGECGVRETERRREKEREEWH